MVTAWKWNYIYSFIVYVCVCVVLVVDYYEGESSMNHLCCMFDTRYLVTEEIGFISASPNTSESEFSYPLYSYVPLIKLNVN